MQNYFFIPKGLLFSVEPTLKFLLNQINIRSIEGEFNAAAILEALKAGHVAQDWQVGESELKIQKEQTDYLKLRIEFTSNHSDFTFYFESSEDFQDGSITIGASELGKDIAASIGKWVESEGYIAGEKQPASIQEMQQVAENTSDQLPENEISEAEKEVSADEEISVDFDYQTACKCSSFQEGPRREFSYYTRKYETLLHLQTYHELRILKCKLCKTTFEEYGRYQKYGIEGRSLRILTAQEEDFVVAKKEVMKNDKEQVLDYGMSSYMDAYLQEKGCRCHEVFNRKTSGWTSISHFTQNYNELFRSEVPDEGWAGVYYCRDCSKCLLLEVWFRIGKYDENGYCAVQLAEKNLKYVQAAPERFEEAMQKRGSQSILRFFSE